MKVFDNVTNIVRDDMEKTIKRNSKVSVAAACFSMYAYSELKRVPLHLHIADICNRESEKAEARVLYSSAHS